MKRLLPFSLAALLIVFVPRQAYASVKQIAFQNASSNCIEIVAHPNGSAAHSSNHTLRPYERTTITPPPGTDEVLLVVKVKPIPGCGGSSLREISRWVSRDRAVLEIEGRDKVVQIHQRQ